MNWAYPRTPIQTPHMTLQLHFQGFQRGGTAIICIPSDKGLRYCSQSEFYSKIPQTANALVFKKLDHLFVLTLSWQGYKNGLSGRGGASDAPPGNTAKIKLQRHVRYQNRGSWVCPTHLDYSQLATMCISRVYTCSP